MSSSEEEEVGSEKDSMALIEFVSSGMAQDKDKDLQSQQSSERVKNVKLVFKDKNLVTKIESRGKLAMLLRLELVEKVGWQESKWLIKDYEIDVYILDRNCTNLIGSSIQGCLYDPIQGQIICRVYGSQLVHDSLEEIYKLVLQSSKHLNRRQSLAEVPKRSLHNVQKSLKRAFWITSYRLKLRSQLKYVDS